DEIRGDCRPCSSTGWPDCDTGIAADLERWREQGSESLVRHEQGHGRRDVHPGLKSDTGGEEVVERGTGPRATVSRDEQGATARSPNDETSSQYARGNQHTPRG